MSPKSAGLAKNWGHGDVRVYSQGAPGWKKAGNYLVSAIDFVMSGNIVLVDLRRPQVVSAGHIPRAVNIPLKELSRAKDKFPSSKMAPIVFYSEELEESREAVNILRKWGYKNNTVFPFEGPKEFLKKGHDIQTGEAATEINWARKRGPGELSIKDFDLALKSDAIQVIDVRGVDEYESGHFPGALNIPLDALPQRLDEVPKDKFIVVHCKTGVRGEMAYLLLKEKGYAVKYLNAKCKCKPDGSYWIWE